MSLVAAVRRWFGQKPRSRRVRPGVEALEARAVPAVAPWTGYVPRVGDRVDALIGQLLPGTANGDAFFRNVSAWLGSSLSPYMPAGPADANFYLSALAGDCTACATVFEAVAARVGVQTRRVAFYGVPIQLSHTTVEAFVGGAWRFYDPTTGIHLTGPKGGTALGIAGARAKYPAVRVVEPTAGRWRGAWNGSRAFAFAPVRGNFLVHRGRPGFDVERTYFVSQAVGGGVVDGAAVRSHVDLARTPVGTVGAKDRSPSDVARAVR